MKPTTNITEQEYQVVKAKYEAYHKARKELCKGRNYVTIDEQKLLPESPTHDEISSLEVYEFRHDMFPKYFAYVDVRNLVVTTWTGEVLGDIMTYGSRYYSNMGDERVNIRVKMINDREYTGIYFKSSGDYCRLRLIKA